MTWTVHLLPSLGQTPPALLLHCPLLLPGHLAALIGTCPTTRQASKVEVRPSSQALSSSGHGGCKLRSLAMAACDPPTSFEGGGQTLEPSFELKWPWRYERLPGDLRAMRSAVHPRQKRR
ncbi:hypothetical protein NL676_027365 [Syzygium grande]|nr:hypothetical protein NL676_027365 [Syzygium grande]